MNKNHKRYLVSSETMQPAIIPGDYIIEDSADKNCTYGDIVSYHFEGNHHLEPYDDVFRVVALPGDSIAVEDDICIVNGKKNAYRYIGKGPLYEEFEEELPNGVKIIIHHYSILFEPGENLDFKAIKVPKDHYFILGDSRTGIYDSRYFGAIPKDKIVGKVIEVIKQ